MHHLTRFLSPHQPLAQPTFPSINLPGLPCASSRIRKFPSPSSTPYRLPGRRITALSGLPTSTAISWPLTTIVQESIIHSLERRSAIGRDKRRGLRLEIAGHPQLVPINPHPPELVVCSLERHPAVGSNQGCRLGQVIARGRHFPAIHPHLQELVVVTSVLYQDLDP